jgi:hypothetical protein
LCAVAKLYGSIHLGLHGSSDSVHDLSGARLRGNLSNSVNDYSTARGRVK